jgi:prephenate dehydrogenase
MKIAVMGAGRMGAWMVGELVDSGNDVAVFDPDPARARQPGAETLKDMDDLERFAPAMLINAASLDRTIEVFQNVLPHLPADCMLVDVASIKAGLREFYEKAGKPFVSIHPMFGPTFANLDSLKEENVIFITESDPAGKQFWRELLAGYGLRMFEYTFEEHDRMMGYSLTIPFVSSMVFAACMDSKAVPGSTFARHMRIAKGLLAEDDHLLSEILFNRFSLDQLDKITARLEFLKHIIRGRDSEEMKKYIDRLRVNVGVSSQHGVHRKA